jgi:hypothetical protein
MKKIDITGGEPSIYPKIDFLVAFCDLLGFKEIRIVTNGVKYFKLENLMNRFRKIRFSLSFHSQNPLDLQKLTQKLDVLCGILEFIKRCKSRINYVNCVITPYNTDLLNLLNILRPFSHHEVTLCIKNLDYNFEHNIKDFRFSNYRKELNEILQNVSQEQRIDIRFFPFCILTANNYERKNIKCCASKSNVYDPMDWNPAISRTTPWYRWIQFIFGTEKMREKAALAQAKVRKNTEDTMIPVCYDCSENMECDGVQKAYLKKFGESEFVPFYSFEN